MTRRDCLAALRLVLAVTGLAAALVLAASFCLDPGGLAVWPECAARKAGGSCALCGMSHSFVAISQGRFEEALAWNPAGPWLYSAFVLLAAAGALAAKYTPWEYLRKSARACTFP